MRAIVDCVRGRGWSTYVGDDQVCWLVDEISAMGTVRQQGQRKLDKKWITSGSCVPFWQALYTAQSGRIKSKQLIHSFNRAFLVGRGFVAWMMGALVTIVAHVPLLSTLGACCRTPGGLGEQLWVQVTPLMDLFQDLHSHKCFGGKSLPRSKVGMVLGE